MQGKTFVLFVELVAVESTEFFPTIYASGKDGLAGYEPDITKMKDITPVFEEILKYIPAPSADSEKPLQMLISNIGKDNYKGRIAIGRIKNGKMNANSDVIHIDRQGNQSKAKITSLSTFKGLTKIEEKEAIAGDIVAVTGILDATIGETIADVNNPIALPIISIEEPTVKMVFMVNDSPFGGREGDFKTSSQIRERLYKELDTDVALRVYDNTDGTWTVCGRGELHLAILIERMRREGYEFAVSQPYVITKEVDGKTLTPFEKVYIDVPEEYSGIVIQHMGIRHAKMDDMSVEGNGLSAGRQVTLEFTVSTKELIGFRGELITDTKGMGIMNTEFLDYLPDDGYERKRDRGSMVAHETGETRLYGLVNVQDQGQLFIGPAVKVYKGQVVGQSSRAGDMSVNVCKEKQLSNMRSKGDGSAEHFDTPKEMLLDDALEYIDDTELVEVTPKSIRIRKMVLDEAEARRKKSMGIK